MLNAAGTCSARKHRKAMVGPSSNSYAHALLNELLSCGNRGKVYFHAGISLFLLGNGTAVWNTLIVPGCMLQLMLCLFAIFLVIWSEKGCLVVYIRYSRAITD